MARHDPAPAWWFLIAAVAAIVLGGTWAAMLPADNVDEANPQPSPIPRRN